MKKVTLITLLLLLGIFISTSFAVEVTLLEKEYVRTKGKPDLYSDTFIGMEGEGKLIITNGDEGGKHRISSAVIIVNGEQVVGSNQFNQKINVIEVPIDVIEDNTISIELSSKPGSYISVKIIQEVDADETVKIGTTDPCGECYFTDNSTLEEVVLEVLDKDDKLPIPNTQVTYWDGEGYEVFLADDPSDEYLPCMGIYPHNSKHIIETGKINEGIYEIYTIDEGNFLGNVVYTWKMETGEGFQTYNYDDTVDYDEYIQMQERGKIILDLLWKGIEKILGISLPIKISEIVDKLFPEEENPPQRWDVYWHRDGYDQYYRLSVIPSNIPRLNITDLVVNGTNVDVSWEGTDKDVYDEGILWFPDNKDLTKYLDGNDTSDLTYSWRITQNGVVYDSFDWTEFNSNTSATINIPNCGFYTLELRVKDEVDNIGDTTVNFNIDEGCACHKFDTDCDGCISIEELMVVIEQWKAGEVSIEELMEAIAIWKECTSANTLSDEFEDGIIDTNLWLTGGAKRGWNLSNPSDTGSWYYSHEEITDPIDGYLNMRVWGPTSGNTYGAEAWVRTSTDFNDGANHIINFTWEPEFIDHHYNAYFIQVTDGFISSENNLHWNLTEHPGTINLLRNPDGGPGRYFENEPSPGKLNWSITTDPSGVARLYDSPNAAGTLMYEGALDLAYPWYIRFMVSDGTSAGFPAGDARLKLLDFAAASSYQVIYQTDFSSDPFLNGWVTNNPDRYKHSDAEGLPPGSLYTENYTNSGDWATTDINYNGESFHLEFDVKPTVRDTGDVCIGLFGPTRVSSSSDTEERLFMLFGGYESQIYISGYNSGGEHISSSPGSGLMVVNEWHHVDIYYDSTSKSVDFQVTRNGTPVLSWQTMMNYGFSSDLLYLGVSMNGSWVTSNRYEVAYIDNVQMSIVP